MDAGKTNSWVNFRVKEVGGGPTRESQSLAAGI